MMAQLYVEHVEVLALLPPDGSHCRLMHPATEFQLRTAVHFADVDSFPKSLLEQEPYCLCQRLGALQVVAGERKVESAASIAGSGHLSAQMALLRDWHANQSGHQACVLLRPPLQLPEDPMCPRV